ncbi:recombinase family protein [Rufibacter sp. DG15C]|uniref:recombinase family protein n=1 Tax=Rufibacter sp. DG15C TaxID=1379909 RepID=UPI0009006EA5
MANLDSFKAFAKAGKSQSRRHSNKVVVYTRVSTKEQADNNQSLATQRKYCDAFALKNGLEVVEYFGGTYESAKTDERKEFNRMLAFVKKSKEQIASIIIYSPDRFSRSGANAIHIAKELQQNNISIRSVMQETNTATASGKFQQNIQFLFSEFDNTQRREKCMAGMLEKLKRGEWPTRVPIGYDQLTNKGQQQIVVNEKGKLLRKAFQWKAEQRLSNVEIIEKLESMGFTLSKQRLTEIFRNPFYCGILSHNLLEGEVVEGKHEKLISQKVFFQINQIQAENNSGYTTKKYDNRLPLRNFIRCASCGTHMTGYEVKKKGIFYYKCNKIGCKVNRGARQMHARYEEVLNGFQLESDLHEPMTQRILDVFQEMNQQKEDELKHTKAHLKTIDQQLEKLEERFVLLEEITKDQYEKFTQKLRLEKKQLEGRLPAEQIKLSNLQKYLRFAVKMCSEIGSMWVSGSYHQRQKLQKLVFPEGVLYDKKMDGYRTYRVNAIFFLIASLSAKMGIKEKGQTSNKTDLSYWVAGTGLEPVTFGL